VPGCEGIDLELLPQVSSTSPLLAQAALASAMSRAAGFLGYCCSRFSDLVAREREFVRGWSRRTNWRWGFNEPKLRKAGKGRRTKRDTKHRRRKEEL